MKTSNKINKSDIFKKAWSLFKKGVWSKFSYALTAAWSQARKTVESIKIELLSGFADFYMTAAKQESLAYVQIIANNITGFAADICKTVLGTKRLSEKQAYWIAKAAFENNI